jgi:hypothetical protein
MGGISHQGHKGHKGFSAQALNGTHLRRVNTKHQAPTSRETPSSNFKKIARIALEIWLLDFLWSLFAFGRIRPVAEMLELGAWNFRAAGAALASLKDS